MKILSEKENAAPVTENTSVRQDWLKADKSPKYNYTYDSPYEINKKKEFKNQINKTLLDQKKKEFLLKHLADSIRDNSILHNKYNNLIKINLSLKIILFITILFSIGSFIFDMVK